MVKETTAADEAAQPAPKSLRAENTLQLPPSYSSLSVRSDNEDLSTGYITASTSRVSQLDSEPATALAEFGFDAMHSSTPTKGSPLVRRPSSDSMTTDTGPNSTDTSQANLASLSSVTTFVPSTLSDNETSDEDVADTDPRARDEAADFVPNYDFDLRDPHERTLPHSDSRFSTVEHDANLSQREAMEGDVLTISHSHATSINAFDDSRPISRSPPHHGSTTSHHDNYAAFPMTLSASWPSLALPPSAVKLQRRRRNILLRVLKTWEGREQVLHLCHSLVLLLYSSLDHPVPQTYSGAISRPVGTLLAFSFARPVRVALMQQIYTTAEGIDNFRRVILIARWVTSATETVMEHWQQRQDNKRMKQRANELDREDLEIELTGDEPIDKPSDHIEGGSRWLQPPSIAPFDADEDEEKGEQSFTEAPASKVGKMTGRGDATGAVGAQAAEDANAEKRPITPNPKERSSSPPRPVTRIFSSLFRHSHLSAAAESLATIGEACESAAVLAGGGMFWRAVGIQRLGLPFLSRRRRQGIERLGIVLSLCSVLISLLVLRMERKALRSELRSAHRRIIRANDKLGWATDLAGTTIDRDLALSHRKRDPSRTRTRMQTDEKLTMLGADLQATANDLDDESSSSSSSLSNSLSETWTVIPEDDDDEPHRHTHHPHPLDMTSILKSTERSLVRAESDLRNTRRRLKLNFWEKVANWSESLFLGYEAAMPHVEKDGVEGWTGFAASAIRLSNIWKEVSWS